MSAPTGHVRSRGPSAVLLTATALLVIAIALPAAGPAQAQSDSSPLTSTLEVPAQAAADGQSVPGPAVRLALWLGDPHDLDVPDAAMVALSPARDGRSGGRLLGGAVVDAEGNVVTDYDGAEVAIGVQAGASAGAADPDAPTASVLVADTNATTQVWDGAEGLQVLDGRLVFDPPVVLLAGERGPVTLTARTTSEEQEPTDEQEPAEEQEPADEQVLADGQLIVRVTGPVDPDAEVSLTLLQGPAAEGEAASLVEVSGLVDTLGPSVPDVADASVGGVDAELFDAGARITRGEFAALVVRVLQAAGQVAAPLGDESDGGLAALSDVGPGHPYASEIAVMLRTDVMRGFIDGTFRPEDLVPRQQAASFLVRTLGVAGVEVSAAHGPSFDDLDDAPVLHVGSIEKLVGTGVLDPGGEFRPREVLRRGEFVAWFMGVVDALDEQRGEVSGWEVLPGFVAPGRVEQGVARFAIDAPGAAAQAISVLEHGLLVGGQLIPAVAVTVGHPVGEEPVEVRPGPGTAAVSVPSRPLVPACRQAPPGRFVDVRGVHAPGIDCVGWWQVAQGRPADDGQGDVYLPDEPVNRAQMATFVARLLAVSGTVLPADPPSTFDDTEGSVHAQAIDQLAAIGVVGGVAAGTYDPGGTVTRAQMASFLARAFEARTERDLPIGPVAFDDVREGATHADNVLRIASAGLTGGVTPETYDPAASVTRAQMGTFLARLLSLLVVEGAAPDAPEDPRA